MSLIPPWLVTVTLTSYVPPVCSGTVAWVSEADTGYWVQVGEPDSRYSISTDNREVQSWPACEIAHINVPSDIASNRRPMNYPCDGKIIGNFSFSQHIDLGSSYIMCTCTFALPKKLFLQLPLIIIIKHNNSKHR